MVGFGLKMAKLDEREDLGITLNEILGKLNQNFYIEKGVTFQAGLHGTWIEMILSDDAWGDESIATTVEAFESPDLADFEEIRLTRGFSVPQPHVVVKTVSEF